jgi:hypothetical protein
MKLFKTLIIILTFLLFLAALNIFFFAFMSPGSVFSLEHNTILQIPTNITSYTGNLQFYPNMLFNHKTLTYSIEDNCDKAKKDRMIQAFSAIENQTDYIIKFRESISEPDIFITCNQSNESFNNTAPGYFVAGEGGVERAVSTGSFWIIEKGKILLFYDKWNPCWKYNIELHELLHVLGLKHSGNKYSIMYPVTDCGQVFSDDIAQEIKRLYTIPELSDLAISNISASKRGIYINFDIEVRNDGLAESQDIKLVLSSRNKTIDTFDMKNINYGEGKILNVENVRVPITMLNLDEITFSVESQAEELEYDNNQVTLELQSQH